MVAELVLALSLTEDLKLAGIQPPIQLVRISGQVKVAPFWIGKYEVTKSQFEAFVQETGYTGVDHPSTKPTEVFLMDWQNGKPPVELRNYPVCYVNWHHARAFCAWLSKKSGRVVRLPTDAEWSLAAMGGSPRTYPWGDAWDPKRCNWGDQGKVDGFDGAAPVGSFPKGVTPEGLFDMAGNIWEWSSEGNLRGGPWCMDKVTLKSAFVAREDVSRCDDKFGLRVCVPIVR